MKNVLWNLQQKCFVKAEIVEEIFIKDASVGKLFDKRCKRRKMFYKRCKCMFYGICKYLRLPPCWLAQSQGRALNHFILPLPIVDCFFYLKFLIFFYILVQDDFP